MRLMIKLLRAYSLELQAKRFKRKESMTLLFLLQKLIIKKQKIKK